MTYATDVASQRLGDAIELYRFDGPQITYAYTSGTRSYVYSGTTYNPLAGLKRSARGSTSSSDKTTLEIEMIGACDLVADYGYMTPPRSLRLRVYEVQRNSDDVAQIWDGDAVACSPVGSIAKFRSTSQLVERLSTPIPAVVFQPRCPHKLGDAFCTVDLETAENKLEATVVSVSSDGYTVTIDSVGSHVDEDFRAGTIIRDDDGEPRTMTRQIGAVLTLLSPFRELAGSDTVTMYVGCKKTVGCCRERHDNIVNFGGHPYMPNSNPFITGVVLADN